MVSTNDASQCPIYSKKTCQTVLINNVQIIDINNQKTNKMILRQRHRKQLMWSVISHLNLETLKKRNWGLIVPDDNTQMYIQKSASVTWNLYGVIFVQRW